MIHSLVLLEDPSGLLGVELSTDEWVLITLNRSDNGASIRHVTDCCELENACESLVSVELVRVHAPVMRVVGHVVVLEEVCLIT